MFKELFTESKEKTIQIRSLGDFNASNDIKSYLVANKIKSRMLTAGPMARDNFIQVQDNEEKKIEALLNAKNIKYKIKLLESLPELLEKVSPDCSTGAGVIPEGPWKDFKVIRTNHLDDKRKPSNKDRDHGFDCDTFDALISKLMQKRPMGLKSGKMQITWKNADGVQAAVINISNDAKSITFVTVMQLNRANSSKYETKGAPNIDLGLVKEPN